MSPSDHDNHDDREWVSFLDDHGDTWLFDTTMLTSNWLCIWGDGCPGIELEPAPESLRGCCSHGAHFSGDEDLGRVRGHARRLTGAQWANHGQVTDPITIDEDGDAITHTVDGVCIFHNPAAFEGGAGCALHIASIQHGEAPVDWKPEVCWQLPLRLEHHEDDNGHNTYFVREWTRRDWGEGGADLGWWCTEQQDAYVGREPVFVSLEPELRALVGNQVYEHLAKRLDVGAPAILPHPTRRER